MTIKKLIAELKKFPPDAEVGLQDQDADENEISAVVSGVSPFDQSKSTRPDAYESVTVVIRAA